MSLASASNEQILEDYGQIPLSFQINEGQTAAQVDFLSQGSGYALFLTPTKSVLSLQTAGAQSGTGASESVALSSSFVGANPQPTVVGLDPLGGTSNYFTGSNPSDWHTDVANYSKVEYQNLYSGVDLVFYGNQQQLEYDYVVAPGTNPGIIKIAIAGAESMTIDSEGNLVLRTAGGDVTEEAPVVYQEFGDVREAVSGHFVLEANNEIGFDVGVYDQTQPLIIDPVLSYSTYLGGTSGNDNNVSQAIAVDSSGDVYVTGQTASINFPVTTGAFQPILNGSNSDAFVTKLNPTGTALDYSTFLGIDAEGYGIAVNDNSGDAYITGLTSSSQFPVTAEAFQSALDGQTNAFVAELNPTGTALVYSTYLGGSGEDSGRGIAIDGTGDAYVTGFTSSANFPISAGAYQTSYGGGTSDAFVTELNPSGTAEIYSTYLGGKGNDFGFGIAISAAGNVYVTGQTSSSDFPVTAGAFETTFASAYSNAFVTELNPTGTGLEYSTYVGGISEDIGWGIAVDSAGDAFITGSTSSSNFPTTPGAYQSTYIGDGDAFVTELNPTGTALVYSSLLGGTLGAGVTGYGIAVDGDGDAFITGYTECVNLPTTVDADQPTYGGGGDAFMTEFNPTGTALIYSTYLGGSGLDGGNALAVDDGNVYIAGQTESTDFPTTAGAYQATYNGSGQQAFVAEISFPINTSIALTTSVSPSTYGDSVTFTATVTTGGSPVTTGTVEFEEGETVLANMVPLSASGMATLAISTLSAITQTITAVYSGAPEFITSNATVQQVVNPKIASVTPNPNSKIYGSADPVLTGMLSGFLPTDDVTASFTRTPGESVVGGPYIISATLSPLDVLANYDVTYNAAPFTITPASLTVTATTGQTMVYGTSPPLLTFTYIGLVNGETSATFTGSLATPATSTSDIGGYLITQGTLSATGNYTIGTFNPAALTVTAAPLTITADDDIKTYGTLASFSSTAFTEIGLVTANTDTITGVTELSQLAPSWAPVGTDPIIPSAATGFGLSNYSITYVNGTLTVTPATLTIAANNDSKIYGTLKTFVSGAFTETGLVTANGDAITAVTETSTGSPVSAEVGTDPIIPSDAIGGGLSNYTISYANGTLTVNPAPLTITADDDSKTYGSSKTFAADAFTTTGLVTATGDAITGVTETSAGSLEAATVGNDAIVPSAAVGSGLSNYTITYVSGTLNVTPAPLTITADDDSKVYGSVAALSDTAFTETGLITSNGDTITSVVETSDRASVSGVVGLSPILPSAAVGTGLSNYSITYVSGTLTVNPAPLFITADNDTKTYGTPTLFGADAFTENGLVTANGDSITDVAETSPGAAYSAPAGTDPIVPIAANGNGLNNYAITFVDGTLTVTPAPLTITATSVSAIAGQPLPALTVTYQGFVNDDGPASLGMPPVIATTATPESPPGAYPINVSGASSTNYTITYVGGIVTVGPALATVQSVTVKTIRSSKHKSSELIAIQFNEAMNSTTVQDLGNYGLVTIPAKRKQKAKTVAIATATYSAGVFTVTIATRKPLVVNPPLKLTIIGAGILDSYGQPLAGNGSTPGTNAVAIITRSGGTVQRALQLVRTKEPSCLTRAGNRATPAELQ